MLLNLVRFGVFIPRSALAVGVNSSFVLLPGFQKIELYYLLAGLLVGAAVGLSFVASEQAQPLILGLLALLELGAARFPARVGADGRPVLLEDQDRRLWDRAAIRRGRAALERAGRPGLGFYGLQAAIAECHAVAGSVAETDWDRIVILYEALAQLAPSPVVDLNRAVAVAMASGPAAGLAIVDGIDLPGHLVPSVRGELLLRLGRTGQAHAALREAIALCTNPVEREALERKLR